MLVEYNTRNKKTSDGKELKKKNINKIYTFLLNQMKNKYYDNNGFVTVNSRTLEKLQWNYKSYIKSLLDDKILDRSPYEVGKKSFGYRFTDKLTNTIEIRNISLGKEETSNIDKNYIDMELSNRLFKDFDEAEVNIEDGVIKEEYQHNDYIDIGKWFRNHVTLERWNSGYKTFKWSRNRLYTNFVNLSSKCRNNNIRLNGEKLKELDIRNSFPLMLCKFCIKKDPDIVNKDDFIKFSQDVVSGYIYSTLRKDLNNIMRDKNKNIKGARMRNLSRDEIKVFFQQYLNSETNRIPYHNGARIDIKKYMSEIYPSINNIIEDIKNNGKVYDTLVKIETEIITKIVKYLYSNIKDIRILTCHDAIYIPRSFTNQVEDIWYDILDEFVKDLPKK